MYLYTQIYTDIFCALYGPRNLLLITPIGFKELENSVGYTGDKFVQGTVPLLKSMLLIEDSMNLTATYIER